LKIARTVKFFDNVEINVANLINCQIAYLLTLWKHDAVLPEFLKEGCLKKDGLGNIQFDFGGDVRVQKLEDLLTIDESGSIYYLLFGQNKVWMYIFIHN
jgi:hypothetical protein